MEADRIEQFKGDLAKMRSKTGRAGLETRLEIFGAVLMSAAAIVAFVTYEVSLSQSDPRNIQSGLTLAITMLILAVVGAALFLRYSMARFLRLWLLRQLYEGQANTERLVQAVDASARLDLRQVPSPAGESGKAT